MREQGRKELVARRADRRTSDRGLAVAQRRSSPGGSARLSIARSFARTPTNSEVVRTFADGLGQKFLTRRLLRERSSAAGRGACCHRACGATPERPTSGCPHNLHTAQHSRNRRRLEPCGDEPVRGPLDLQPGLEVIATSRLSRWAISSAPLRRTRQRDPERHRVRAERAEAQPQAGRPAQDAVGRASSILPPSPKAGRVEAFRRARSSPRSAIR